MTSETILPANSVVGIIITYNPDFKTLTLLIDSIKNQVEKIIVIDNGSKNDVMKFTKNLSEKIYYKNLDNNYGIAKAHNIGIDIARQNGFKYVLLLDQDSLPSFDMVNKLYNVAEEKAHRGVKVACLGVRYEDPRQKNPPPFISIEGIKLIRHACNCETDVIEVDYLISSGSLIPMATLDVVGGMREELFIDYVDIEWGLRAQNMGYHSFGVCAAYMQHDLGDNPIVFLGRKIPVHSPTRHYYHFRNAIWLYKQSWLKTNWKIVDGIKLIRKFIFYSIFTQNRLIHIRMMIKGIIDALRNKMGPIT